MKKIIALLSFLLIFSTAMPASALAFSYNDARNVNNVARNLHKTNISQFNTMPAPPDEDIDWDNIVWTTLGEVQVPADKSRGYERITVQGAAIRSGYDPGLQIYVRWSGPYGVSQMYWKNLVVRTDVISPSFIYGQFPNQTALCSGAPVGTYFVGYTDKEVQLSEKTVSMSMTGLYATVFAPGDSFMLAITMPSATVVIN